MGCGIRSSGRAQEHKLNQGQTGTTLLSEQVNEGEGTAAKVQKSGVGEIEDGGGGFRGSLKVDRNTTNMAVEMPELQLLNLEIEKLEPLRKEIGSDSRVREIEAESLQVTRCGRRIRVIRT